MGGKRPAAFILINQRGLESPSLSTCGRKNRAGAYRLSRRQQGCSNELFRFTGSASTIQHLAVMVGIDE